MLESWQRFGQVQTIAIGPGGEVYDGHQRLSALLTLHGPSYRVDARQSDRALTDEERRALVVMLHAGAVGAWDWDALSGWDAEALQGWGMDAELLADWQTDIFALRTMIETTPDFEPVDESEQPRLDQKSPVTCPECGHEFIPG
jgi:hypothetical protein